MRSINRTSTIFVATAVSATTTAAAPKVAGPSRRSTKSPCATPTAAQTRFAPVRRAAEGLNPRSLGRKDIVVIDKQVRVFERLDEVLRAISVGSPCKGSKRQPQRSDAPGQHDHLMRLDV